VISNLSRAAAAAAVLVTFVSFRVARADDLPKADTILDKNMEATGGKEAHQKVKNRVTKATIEISAAGLKGEITIYAAAPNKLYVVTELTGVGKIEEGSDGKVAWSVNPMTGPRIKDGTEKETALRRADFEGESNWRKHTKKAESKGEDTVDGKACYVIEITTDEGQTKTHYYDKSSYLLIKSSGTEKTPNGDIQIESIFSDFKKVDGITMPFKTKQSALGTEFTVTIDKVEHNVQIPDNRFDLPDDIKKLVGKSDK
jgi:outer membrane lipoprotein-sorting protein